MKKSTYECKQCFWNCKLEIQTWFINPNILCPHGCRDFKWVVSNEHISCVHEWETMSGKMEFVEKCALCGEER